MEFFKNTFKMLFVFTTILIFSIIIIFLLQPNASPAKKVNVASTEPKSLLSNQQYILEQSESITTTGQIIYGKSGLDVNLICDKVSSDVPAKSIILMTFEIHGYEDLYPKDGQVLVNIGNSVANYFTNNRNQLNECELYVVASANPDGLTNGVSNNGKGRCQVSLGVNINRDFPFDFMVYTDSRDHTLSQPLAAPESRALRDLVDALKPNVVIDCHGWENGFIGDKGLANCFKSTLHISDQSNFTVDNHGYFSAWASTQGAKAMLIEFPQYATVNTQYYENGTIAGIKNLTAQLSN